MGKKGEIGGIQEFAGAKARAEDTAFIEKNSGAPKVVMSAKEMKAQVTYVEDTRTFSAYKEIVK